MRVLVALILSVNIALGISLAAEATPPRTGLIAFERDYSIYVVNPEGSGLRVLAKKGEQGPGEGDGYLFNPAFTPDGSRITYTNGYRTTHQSVVVRRAAGGPPSCTRSTATYSTRLYRSRQVGASPLFRD